MLETPAVPAVKNRVPLKSGSDVWRERSFERGWSRHRRAGYRRQVTSRPQPAQHAPPAQWLRVRYAKRGRARFTSHRDFGRAFERALRRAGVPMAYSSGFSPHPRISYANAAPTGAASEAEYLEIGLAEACDPAKVRDALDAALPTGLDVVEVVASPAGSLADRLTASRWRIELTGVPREVTEAAIQHFLGAASVPVERMTRTGLREFDARSAVVSLSVEPDGLDLVLAHQVPLVRPDDVLVALAALTPEFAPPAAPVLTRLSQGQLDAASGQILEP
jgi:radical SAM-linked protein